jgi:undecaprenyl-diphosphatase
LQDIIRAIVMGIVQGLTEFIPVSSSAHLALVPWLLGWEPAGFLFDLMLHWGTLLAVAVVFWRDFLDLIGAWFRSIGRRSLAEPMGRVAWFIILGSIPAVVLGFFFKDFVEGLFLNPLAIGFFLLITAALLALAEILTANLRNPRSLERMNWGDALAIGFAQALALAPGISRSGSTIATGLARGLRREEAARFSFLLGTPVIFGAGLLALVDALQTDAGQVVGNWLPLLAGFVAAAVAGVLAIRFLLRYLRNHTLYVFSIYCLVLGVTTIVLSMTGWR